MQLAHSFHVSLKECPISGNFSIGDIMAGERQELMAASPSLWEQAMLLPRFAEYFFFTPRSLLSTQNAKSAGNVHPLWPV